MATRTSTTPAKAAPAARRNRESRPGPPLSVGADYVASAIDPNAKLRNDSAVSGNRACAIAQEVKRRKYTIDPAGLRGASPFSEPAHEAAGETGNCPDTPVQLSVSVTADGRTDAPGGLEHAPCFAKRS